MIGQGENEWTREEDRVSIAAKESIVAAPRQCVPRAAAPHTTLGKQ